MLRQYMFLPILVLRLGAAVSAQRVSIDVDILGPLDWLTEELEGVNEGVHHTDSLNEVRTALPPSFLAVPFFLERNTLID